MVPDECSGAREVAILDAELNVWAAIREGDVVRLRGVIETNPEIVSSHLGSLGRTPLHVVTDWPGYFPNGPEVAEVLISSGADVNARGVDGTGETPLHWAASSDDAAVAEVLIRNGADLNGPDGSIGTPLMNAVGYGCWNVARLLVAHGAVVEHAWVAAGLGLIDRLIGLVGEGLDQADLDQALWHACAGGQRRAADLLIGLGASLDFTPEYGRGTMIDAARMYGTQRANLIERLEQLMAPRQDTLA